MSTYKELILNPGMSTRQMVLIFSGIELFSTSFQKFFVKTICCKLNYHDQKIWQTLAHDTWNHWTAVSTLLGFISSVYCDLPHWRSNQ